MDLKWKRVGGSRWTAFRKLLILERGPICEKCAFKTDKLIADHIRPIYLGGPEFDKNNVQLLCKKCDKKKTKIDLSIISWLNLK